MSQAEPEQRRAAPGNEPRDPVDFFHEHASRYAVKHYSTPEYSFVTVRQHRVLDFVAELGLRPGARMLDAGCGPGELVQALLSMDLEVWAIDAAIGMVLEDRRRLNEGGHRPPPRLP